MRFIEARKYVFLRNWARALLDHARKDGAASLYLLGYLRGLMVARFGFPLRGAHARHMRALDHDDPDFRRGYRDGLHARPPNP